MFKTEEMTKILIVCPDTYQKAVIEKLYSLGVLHIKEHKSTNELDIGSPMQDASSLSETIVSIRAIASHLKIDLNKEIKKSQKKQAINLDEIKANSLLINSEILSSENRMKEIDDALRIKKLALPELNYLSKLKISFGNLSGISSLDVFIGIISKSSGFIDSINAATKKYEIVQADSDGKLVIGLFSDKSANAKVQAVLQKHGFSVIDIKKYFNPAQESMNPEILFGNLNNEIKSLEEEKSAVEKKLSELKSRWNDYIVYSEKLLGEELEKAESPLRFGKTRDSFIVTGFVPEKSFDKVSDELKKTAKDKIYIKKLDIGEHEHVPSKLHNPKLVKSFEFFMNLYSLPSHNEIDPTFFVFLTFPLFFGFMLGDWGYGIVCLILFYLLKRAIPKAGFFFNILMLASFFSIVFGFVFGEFFGFEHIKILGYTLPSLISRNPEHPIKVLMGSAVLLGLIHVNIGIAIGFANELHHGLFKAICAKGAWFVLEIGVIMLVLSKMNIWKVEPNLGMYLSFGVMALSVIMLAIGEGFRGIIEIPALFGSMLSYLRLMAIGLSSVGLALVINNLATPFFENGLSLLVIPGILILVLGHALNIAIGILGSSLHSLRLHYVEFFTKFYKGGGIPYKPFGERKITQENT